MEASNNDDLSFDIAKIFPVHVCDNIFGNLKAADLLKASLVSKEWYKFIAKSAVCMQKLRLKFSSKELKGPVKFLTGILMNSDRKYENVEFNYVKYIDMRNILQICGIKWKKVTITVSSSYFLLFLDFFNFIAIVEPFVEELKMKHAYIYENPRKPKLSEQQKKSLRFPNLKCLELDYCHESIIELFLDVVTLTEFNLNMQVNPTAIKAIQKMIYYNKGLEKLSTIDIAFDQMICGEISSDKLISLQINDTFTDRLSEVTKALIKTNIKQLLELRMNTLETLSLDDWMGLDATKVIFQMSKLKHLSLGGLRRAEETVVWNVWSFKQSLSLTSLDLVDYFLKTEKLRAIITATPNVKKLKLYSINDESIACISELLPKLESLSVHTSIVFNVINKSFLANLKEFLPIRTTSIFAVFYAKYCCKTLVIDAAT